MFTKVLLIVPVWLYSLCLFVLCVMVFVCSATSGCYYVINHKTVLNIELICISIFYLCTMWIAALMRNGTVMFVGVTEIWVRCFEKAKSFNYTLCWCPVGACWLCTLQAALSSVSLLLCACVCVCVCTRASASQWRVYIGQREEGNKGGNGKLSP